MIIFSIIFAPLFTLLTILTLKNSTDEWGDPFKIKIIYIIILFFFLLIYRFIDLNLFFIPLLLYLGVESYPYIEIPILIPLANSNLG